MNTINASIPNSFRPTNNVSVPNNKRVVTTTPKIDSEQKNDSFITKKNAAIVSGAVLLVTALAFHKKITNIVKSIFQTSSSKAEKPQYLYHMTSKDAYESIMSDGKIKVSDIENGVFMTSYDNLKNKTPKETLLRMVNFYDGGSFLNPSNHRHTGSVFVLKIPVVELMEEKLGFRRIRLVDQDNSNISDELINISEFLSDRASTIIDKPLEFIYKSEIPTDKIEKVIEIKTDSLNSSGFVSNFFSKIK